MKLTKEWIETQFQNFANKINSIFVKTNDLSAVSFSGNYNDLFDKPNIPDKISELENDNKYLTETGNVSNTMVAFEQAVSRVNLQSGDSLSAAFGKLSKLCADIKQVAFSNSYTDLYNKPNIPSLTNNLLAAAPGTALDAVAGKQLDDKIMAQNRTIETIQSDLSALGNNVSKTIGTGISKPTPVQWKDITLTNYNYNAVVIFSNWTGDNNFPENYGSGIVLPCYDVLHKRVLYIGASGKIYSGICKSTDKNITWFNG